MKDFKIRGLMLTGVFLITIFGFLLYAMMSPSREQSVLENRELAQRPDLTMENLLSGDYFKRFEQYYNDQFPIRDFFIEANAFINKNIFKQDVVKDVYVADNGYLLSQIVDQTPADASRIADRINQLANQLAKDHVNLYTALIPNKSTMLEQEFPAYFPSYGQKNLNMLFSDLNKNTNPIDSRETLSKHLNEQNMFFYTDHHWEAKAAFYAYQNIMSQVFKKEKMDEHVYQYNDYTWKLIGKSFYGSDARKTTSIYVKHPDKVLVAELKDKHKPFVRKWGIRSQSGLYNMDFLSMSDKYTNRYQAYLGGDYAQLLINNPNKTNGKKVLVIKDSYANAFIQFIVPHYKEVHVLDLRYYNKMSIEKYVQENKIDQVILFNNVNSIYVTPALTNFNHPGQGENQ